MRHQKLRVFRAGGGFGERGEYFFFISVSFPYFCSPFRGCGVIGSRTRLRIWRFTAWGFESLHPHTGPQSSFSGGFGGFIVRTGFGPFETYYFETHISQPNHQFQTPMNITLDQKDNANAAIRVTLGADDYQPRVDKKLKEYTKNASIKGFRPGKVPSGMIRKMYGKSVLVEEINSLLSESVDGYIKENKLAIVGDPLPNQEEAANIDWETQREFSFSYDIGMVPEFSVDLGKLNLTRHEIEIADKDIEDSVENLRTRNGTYINPEQAEADDLLMGTLTQVGGEFRKENAYVFLKRVKDEAKANFIGAKKGDAIVFDIQNTFDDADSVRMMTQLPQEQASALTGDFELAVAEIDRQVPAEMNEEFFKKIHGEETTTEEQFRARLRTDMEKLYAKEADSRLSRDIQEQLVDTTEIELPNEFLKRWLRISNKEVSDEDIEKDFGTFVKGLKWTVIKDKIAKENDLKVEHDEVNAQAKASFKEVYSFLGNDTPENEALLTQLTDNFLKAEKGQNYMNTFQRVFTDKVAAFVKDSVPVEIKKISAEEFNKQAAPQDSIEE